MLPPTSKDRFNVLDPDRPNANENRIAQSWQKAAQHQVPLDDYQDMLFEILKDIGCNPNDAPYVFTGVHENGRFESVGPKGPLLLSAFLDEPNCLATRGLPAAEKERLRYFAVHAPNAKTNE
jgi:hypothetical protein